MLVRGCRKLDKPAARTLRRLTGLLLPLRSSWHKPSPFLVDKRHCAADSGTRVSGGEIPPNEPEDNDHRGSLSKIDSHKTPFLHKGNRNRRGRWDRKSPRIYGTPAVPVSACIRCGA